MSIPAPLRFRGCTGTMTIGGCPPPASVIVLPRNGGSVGSPRMPGSWLPASPRSSFVEPSALTASPLPGVAIGRSRPVTSLHASPHLVESLYGPSGSREETRYGPREWIPETHYGTGGLLGKGAASSYEKGGLMGPKVGGFA